MSQISPGAKGIFPGLFRKEVLYHCVAHTHIELQEHEAHGGQLGPWPSQIHHRLMK